jgi:hypothetical protein
MTTELAYKPLQTTATNGAEVLVEENKTVYIPAEVEAKKKISTLYVTDMPFTSKSALAKVPVIGYEGITDKYSENLFTLDPDFTQLLSKKKVHSVVLLFNSDIVDPHFEPGSNKDLSAPLDSVYCAVKKFKELVDDFDVDITVWFAHIKHLFLKERITTIDDLYKQEDTAAVDAAIKSCTSKKDNSFFDKINLTDSNYNRLYNHLKLKNALSFYSYFSDQIKFKEFVFKSVRYAYDGDKLEKIQYTDTSLYLRVGPDYYKRIMTLNSHNEYEEQLTNWKIGEINRDYGKEFIRQIPKYDAFINRPCNTGEYQKTYSTNHNGIVSNLFNIYNPVDHEPAAGEWPTIKKFLTHIFSAANLDGEVLFEFGLDYLQLTYEYPKQRLPILCLVSSERNTGKSTFLDFLKKIFGANVSILDNQRFNPKFTSHFAGKLIVAIDEGHIPVNDKMTKEMIKNMATGKVMWLEAKGSNAKGVENFTHLVFCSNDEKNFMQIDDGENRFAVIKVPSFRKAGEKDDPDMLDKMGKEIPAFLNFLQNRRLSSSKKETRFWFPESVYTTEALRVVMDRTKNTIESELEEFFTDAFLNFGQNELNYTLKDLHAELNKEREFKLPVTKLKDLLLDKYGIKPGGSRRCKYFTTDKDGEPKEHSKKGRFLTFYAENWLSQEDFKELEENTEEM